MHIGLSILQAKPAIKRLFLDYGIDEPVTVETVELALHEEDEDFERELMRILDSVAHNKGQAAMDWISTLGGLGTGIAGTIMANKNQGGGSTAPQGGFPQSQPQQPIIIQQPPAEKKDNSNQKVMIAVAIVALMAVALYFAMGERKKK